MKVVTTYAFLDPGSNVSFCSEDLCRELGVSGSNISLELKTMGEQQNLKTQRIELHTFTSTLYEDEDACFKAAYPYL